MCAHGAEFRLDLRKPYNKENGGPQRTAAQIMGMGGVEPLTSTMSTLRSNQLRAPETLVKPGGDTDSNWGIAVLQTAALPLGYVAAAPRRVKNGAEDGFEPATLALARRCSTSFTSANHKPSRWCRGRIELPTRGFFSPLLYQLSYLGAIEKVVAEATGVEPAISCVTSRHVNHYTTPPHI